MLHIKDFTVNIWYFQVEKKLSNGYLNLENFRAILLEPCKKDLYELLEISNQDKFKFSFLLKLVLIYCFWNIYFSVH